MCVSTFEIFSDSGVCWAMADTCNTKAREEGDDGVAISSRHGDGRDGEFEK